MQQRPIQPAARSPSALIPPPSTATVPLYARLKSRRAQANGCTGDTDRGERGVGGQYRYCVWISGQIRP
jgi:hypothetical protein